MPETFQRLVHREAAKLLRGCAADLERSFTVRGSWDEADPEVAAEYRHLLHVAELLESGGDLAPDGLCGHVLDGPLEDGGYLCVRCRRIGDWRDGMIEWRDKP